MNLGERLLALRKAKGLSQEEVAEKLNVTRQTVSKWETDGSTPDFDKIVPLCNLYGITADELLTGAKSESKKEYDMKDNDNRLKKTKGIVLGIFMFFIAVAWIIVSILALKLNPILSSAVFLLICGLGVAMIVYSSIYYKNERIEKKNKLLKQIDSLLGLVTLVIYLLISFATSAWHITWVVWIIYALVMEIVKLVFLLRGESIEE